MSKSAKAMNSNNTTLPFDVPSFSFGRRAVIRPLPGGSVEQSSSKVTLEQLKQKLTVGDTSIQKKKPNSESSEK